jgi:hypothetical protein
MSKISGYELAADSIPGTQSGISYSPHIQNYLRSLCTPHQTYTGSKGGQRLKLHTRPHATRRLRMQTGLRPRPRTSSSHGI